MSREPMDYRTAIGLESAIRNLRRYEELADRYRAESEAAVLGSPEWGVAGSLRDMYEMGATAIRTTLAGFEGAFGAESPDELAAMAAADQVPA